MTERRFPPPWSVEGFDACFVVKDSSGQKLKRAGDPQPNCSPKMRRAGLRPISPSCRDCCEKPKAIAAQRLALGIVRKGDQGRKTGAATRAMPNVTCVLVAPILGSHRRNQLGIAVNATHQHGDPHSPPRPAIIVPLHIGKSESISGPLLLCGVDEWIGQLRSQLVARKDSYWSNPP
jgi:hypothetical protein